MLCNYCGNQIEDGTAYCPYCGAQMQQPYAQQTYAQQPMQQTYAQQPMQQIQQPYMQQHPMQPMQQPYMQQQPMQQMQQPYAQQPMQQQNNAPAKKSKLPIIIAIIAVVIIAIVAVVIGVNNKKKDKEDARPKSGYTVKSKASNDITSAKTIKTAVETVMCREATYELLCSGGTVIILDPDKSSIDFDYIDYDAAKKYIDYEDDAKEELLKNLSNVIPGFKIDYALDDTDGDIDCWYVVVSNRGNVTVYTGPKGLTYEELSKDKKNDGIFQLCPETCEEYKPE